MWLAQHHPQKVVVSGLEPTFSKPLTAPYRLATLIKSQSIPQVAALYLRNVVETEAVLSHHENNNNTTIY